MIRTYLFLTLLILSIKAHSETKDSILSVLDQTIDNSKVYTQNRIAEINTIKEKLNKDSLSPILEYELNNSLFDLYRSYISDSAIVYIRKNIILARNNDFSKNMLLSQMKYASHLSSCGYFLEAINQINLLDRSKSIQYNLLEDYYTVCDQVFGEAGFYSGDNKLKNDFLNKSKQYKDSLYSLLDFNDERFLSRKETELRDKGEYAQALDINNKRLKLTDKYTQTFAIIMYYRALIYDKMNDNDKYIQCLALSAISDIRNATKDHASLWMLAQALLDNGDVERAYKYMNFSWNDTKFYKTRLRAWQSSDNLSLIDNTYRIMLQESNKRMKISLIVISLLSIAAIILSILIYMQMKKLAYARRCLLDTNKQLLSLNEELKNMNIEIKKTNDKLNESNLIKDEYILKFTKLCSTYINRLDDLRRMANKMITGNKVQELLRLTRSESLLEEPLNVLYANFDSSFLKLFPNFIEDFNNLIRDEERIIPKNKGELNTELRIFALIRLGINDSSQIAEFLRYSVNTIYNYRAKVKSKAKVSRDEFENMVCNIK